MIKIYGRGRTRWTKCLWMARELEIPIEMVDTAWNEESRSFGDASYKKIHPFGLVPALEDGSLRLFESQAIINYLGEKYPEKRLIPKSGTHERALYDQWTFFCVGTLESPLWNWFRHNYIFDDSIKNPQESKRCSEELKKHLTTLNSMLDGVKFLVGTSFSAADITMTYTLNWAASFGFLEDFQNLKNYIKPHLQRPAYPHDLYTKK